VTTEVGHHHHNVDPKELTSVEAHLADILDTIRPLPPTQLGITEAEGCVLAEDITASRPLPPFDNSAMDGYALMSSDVTGASKDSPITLRVSGEVAAGDTGAYAITPGSALRITTGAQLPGGADAVVPVEDTDGGVAQVRIRAAVQPRHAVRFSGGDAREGEVLLPRGTRLGPMQIAVLAASGHARAEVHPRPRVVVISTGDELIEPGHTLRPGKIWDSNSFMLAAAAREAGCLAFRHGPVPDDPLEMLPAIEDQLLRADLVVTSGGVSMGGRHDVVKDTLGRLGTIQFRKVAMQPGMPQGFGTIGEDRTPIFTLPGNPVSAYVSFQVFVLAALGALQGQRDRQLPSVRATVTAPLHSPPGRRSYLRGVLNRANGTVAPLSGQGSHQVATLGKANALIVVPEWVVHTKEGDDTEVLCLP
jgi:molybdopterin molybdotransferase